MQRRACGLAMLVAGLWLAAPAVAWAADDAACQYLGTKRQLVAELFFGRNIGDSFGVTDELWTQFATDTLATTLPGMTMFNALGEWYDPDRKAVVRERTKYVISAMDDAPESYAKVKAVMDEYKKRFNQGAVGVTLAVKCAAF